MANLLSMTIVFAILAWVVNLNVAHAADLYDDPPPPSVRYYAPPVRAYFPPPIFFVPRPQFASPCLPGFVWRVYPDGNGECWPLPY
jgi:hypothetical protein